MTDAERQTAYHESIWKPAQRKRTEYWQSMWEKSMHNPKNKDVPADDVVMSGDLPYPDKPISTPYPWASLRGEPNAPCCKEGEIGVEVRLDLDVAAELARILALFRERQAKYGPKNIAEFGEVGVVVRLYDKLARLRNFYFDGGAGDMADESVEDAWSDIACYAVIALVCKKGRWPGAKASRTPKDAL